MDHIKKELWLEQGGKCAICKDPMSRNSFDVDHKIPYSKAGGSEKSNLQLTHASCNRSRGNDCDRRSVIENLEDRIMNLRKN
ncbi:HNH endonuclease [Vibrio parahaemolyticus]|nr:HNH endonuclease [Vibrio parahaemolyticus]